MKLTFLGTGTSVGVPMIGCTCEVCRSKDPRDKRLRASALITVGDKSILIDSGPDFRQQILALDSPKIDALLVTHHHYDHVGGIDDLRPYCYPDGFDVYCNADTDRNLRHNVPYGYADVRYPGAPAFNNHVLVPFVPFEIEGIEIVPLAVKHFKLDILGFRIGRLAYITDASFIPEETIDAIRGVDTLVVNALRPASHFSHMNLSEALDVINVVKPRMAYLTHMSHEMGLHAWREPQLPENVRLAYDGLTIEIP